MDKKGKVFFPQACTYRRNLTNTTKHPGATKGVVLLKSISSIVVSPGVVGDGFYTIVVIGQNKIQ